MDDNHINNIKKKSLTGIISLTSRTLIIQVIAFISTFLLTIYLDPGAFGVFYVVSALISFLTYFSDIGLAAALIQKKTDLDLGDLRTTFTIQQGLVFSVIAVALIFSRQITGFYNLEEPGVQLFYALLFAFALSSLKTIPSVILERKLDFNKLVIPQILETISFYSVAVTLAYLGFGISSFTWAVVTRSIVGLISIYVLSPWKIGFSLNLDIARELTKFGVPFQLNSFLALIKDDLLTIFLGKALPLSHVGYIGWSKKWAETPMRLVLDSVVKVTFPAFSRIQHQKDLLKKAIEKTLFGMSVVIFPLTSAVIFFIQPFIDIYPKYQKWQPAVLSFWLFALGSAVSGLSVPLTNTLNALGKIRTTLKLMVMWTALTWVLTVLLIRWFGFNGVSMALLLITFTIVIVIRIVKNIVDFSVTAAIKHPLIGVIFQSCAYYLIFQFKPQNIITLVLEISAGMAVYFVYIFATCKNSFVEIYRSVNRK